MIRRGELICFYGGLFVGLIVESPSLSSFPVLCYLYWYPWVRAPMLIKNRHLSRDQTFFLFWFLFSPKSFQKSWKFRHWGRKMSRVLNLSCKFRTQFTQSYLIRPHRTGLYFKRLSWSSCNTADSVIKSKLNENWININYLKLYVTRYNDNVSLVKCGVLQKNKVVFLWIFSASVIQER